MACDGLISHHAPFWCSHCLMASHSMSVLCIAFLTLLWRGSPLHDRLVWEWGVAAAGGQGQYPNYEWERNVALLN